MRAIRTLEIMRLHKPQFNEAEGCRAQGHVPGARPCLASPDGARDTMLRGVEWRLEQLVSSMSGLVGGMENRFLPLGRDLETLMANLNGLTRAAEEGLARLREELGSSHGGLNARVVQTGEAMQRTLREARLGLQPLTRVAQGLERLCLLGQRVSQIARFLRVCGINFAIESAGSERCSGAFAPFVEELRQLAAKIGGLSDRMEEDSIRTLRQLNSAVNAIQADLKELEGLAVVFAKSAGEIQRLLEQVGETLNQVEIHRRAISEKTSQVLLHLQLGDLVRQKCEHVLAGEQDAWQACQQALAADQNPGTARLILQTEADQLVLVRRELTEACDRLPTGYMALGHEFRELTRAGRRLDAGEAGAFGEQQSAWSRLERCLDELEAMRQQETRLGRHAVETAAAAGSSVEALNRQLRGIEHMSSDLHQLALNALTQTARLGHEGRTLFAVGQQVGELRQSCAQVLEDVMAVLKDIGEQLGLVGGQELQSGGDDALGQGQLARARQAGHDLVQEMFRWAAQGEATLAQALKRLDALTDLSAQIETHHSDLQQTLRLLPVLEDETGAVEIKARLAARFTMRSEREVHELIQANAPGLQTGAPSRITGASLPGVPALATATAGPLDDNIELF